MKILVLILVLISILVLINSNSTFKSTFSIKEKLYNGDKWAKYRLGDVFIMDKKSKHWDPSFYDNLIYHNKDYPGTIADEYILKNISGVSRNTQLLQEIINKRRIKINTFNNNLLVLHIRTGDVICKKFDWQKNALEMYSKKGNKTWWNGIINFINTNNISDVIILSGSHFKECLEESAEYLLDREIFLKNNTGVNVEYRLGQSPDDDLLLVSNVKYFISTGGNYGLLLETVNNLYN